MECSGKGAGEDAGAEIGYFGPFLEFFTLDLWQYERNIASLLT